MATFAESIAQAFFSETLLTWHLDNDQHAVATFKVGPAHVEVKFERKEADGPWYVSFDVEKPTDPLFVHFAFHIFNGVFDAVEEFLAVRAPSLMIFATKREELASIYETYLRRENERIRNLGYELAPRTAISPYTEFVLRRQSPTLWREQ